jgi:hypothetical protein
MGAGGTIIDVGNILTKIAGQNRDLEENPKLILKCKTCG